MPKPTRKRKHSNIEDKTAPKSKLRPFEDDSQMEVEHASRISFGGSANFLRSLEEAEREAGSSNDYVDSGVGEGNSSDEDKKNARKPAWTDEDEGIDVGCALNLQRRQLPKGGINERSNKYSDLLKHKFTSIVGTPKWATLPDKNVNYDSDEDVLRTCGFIKNVASKNLPAGNLQVKKMEDLNRETYSEGPFINAVEFHPSSSVALVAGNKGIATLYAVDGKSNSKLHSCAFDRFPIFCAKFNPNGNEVILGSRYSYAYSYDLMTAQAARVPLPSGLTQCKNFVMSPESKYIAVAGKWGNVYMLSANTKEKLTILKQDGEVTALTFNASGSLLYGHSDSGEVTIWDMNMQRVKHKWFDEGCLRGTVMAASPSNQFIATGSAQGVVNLYETEEVLQNKSPKPRKAILNLTTGITDLKFNPTSEVLALCSADIPNSVRMFHVASLSVFSNFPNTNTKLGFVNVLNFSPSSGYIAFGNNKSTVALYRLKHYKSY